MRIIAGEARGRRLLTPAGLATRPTSDRVRQSVFDWLAVRQVGGRVLDVFAGSGALGLEALSRGAEYATFIDNSAAARKAIVENLARCRFQERAQVLGRDFRAALAGLKGEDEKYSLVFVDPPWQSGYYAEVFSLLTPLLEVGAYIMIESAVRDEIPTIPSGWRLESTRRYGETLVSIYRYG